MNGWALTFTRKSTPISLTNMYSKKMKKVLIVTMALSMALMGCSNSGNGNKTLTKTGFNVVQLGMPIKDLPKSIDGLYDEIEEEKIEDFDYEGVVYHLRYNDKRTVALSENEGRINAIEIYTDLLKTAEGFSILTTPAELLSAGAKAHCDNYGYEGLLYKGMLFSGTEFTASGLKKAEDAYLYGTDQVFTIDDYVQNAHPVKVTLTQWYSETEKD